MRIALFGKGYSDFQKKFLQLLLDVLHDSDIEVIFFEPYLKSLTDAVLFHQSPKTFSTYEEVAQQADMLFSVGGDGTILDTVPYVRGSGIPILGINLGRMGFLSSVSKDEIEEAVKHVKSGNYTLDKRAFVTARNLRFDFVLATLNFCAQRPDHLPQCQPVAYSGFTYTLMICFLNTYYGDGLIVATPTGSTAYSFKRWRSNTYTRISKFL